MTVTDSRVRRGKLTFTLTGGGSNEPFEASCQPTTVTLTPKVGDSSSVETLCGDSLDSDGLTTWSLTLTAIQDWTNKDGFVLWTLANDGKTATFSWKPNDDPATGTFTGTVTVQALAIGGDVGKSLTSDADWPMTGPPVLTPAPPPVKGSSAVAGG